MGRAVAVYAAAFAAAAALFLLFPGIDLWTAGLFYHRGAGFFLGDTPAVRWIYRAVPYVTDVIVAAVPALYLVSRLRSRPVWGIDGRAAAFLLLALALGPGLVVNTVLKDHWGRARPSQVTEFGGTERFTPALLPADQCPRNCSFPAGHPAMGFYLVAFAFLVPEPRRRRLAVGAALGLGAVIGVARMAAGGHFLSDVVFSGFIVSGVTWLVYRGVIADDWLARHLAALSLPRRLALPALLLLAGVLLSIAFLDRRVAWLVHGTDPGVRQVFEFITQFGLGKGYLIISAALFAVCRLGAALLRDPQRTARLHVWAQRALYVFLAVAVSGIIADIMKPIFGRARPKLLFADGIYGFNWGAAHADYWSFPSGHATTMGALVVALSFLWPRGLPLYLIAALLVMASRIIIAAHYPSDVIVGAVLGGGIAWALWRPFARAGAAPGRGADQPLASAER